MSLFKISHHNLGSLLFCDSESELNKNIQNKIEFGPLDDVSYLCPCCHDIVIREIWGNNVYACDGSMIDPYTLRICSRCTEAVIAVSECSKPFIDLDEQRIYQKYIELLKVHPIFEKERC